MRRWLSVLALLGCVSCKFGQGDAKVPGEPLGTFEVIAELQSSTCGAGALGSTDIWEFNVQLSKDLDQLFWLNGQEVIPGKLARDGESFEFDTRVQVEVFEPEPGILGCTLNRQDRASGQLDYDKDDEEAVTSFNGRLTFAYIPTSDSDCSPLMGVEGGFSTLPCEMKYDLVASRTDSGADGADEN